MTGTRVVVLTMGTPSCRAAERRGVELAGKAGALRLLYVADADFLSSVPKSTTHEAEAHHDLEVIGRLVLRRAVEDARRAGAHAESFVLESAAVAELVRAIKGFRASHVIMSKRHHEILVDHLKPAGVAALTRDAGAAFEVLAS